MSKLIATFHQRFLVRRRLFRLHRKLHSMSLRGMGLFNYETDRVSGELWFSTRTVNRPALPFR